MTSAELDKITKVVRKCAKHKKKCKNARQCQQGAVSQALSVVNKARRRRGEAEISRTPIYRFVNGMTHGRARTEKRGRPKSLTKRDVKKILATRRRLIQKAKGEYRVTYKDIVEASGYKKVCGQKCIEDALRAEGVRYKAPRKKIGISSIDAAKRLKVAKQWKKRRLSYRRGRTYYDVKAFPLPLTSKQRSRFRQTQVTGHLRLPSEGTDMGFTRPREAHCWIGVPSTNIAAAVAKDKSSCGTMWGASGMAPRQLRSTASPYVRL